MKEFKGTKGEWSNNRMNQIATNDGPVCDIVEGDWGDVYQVLELVECDLLQQYKIRPKMIAYGNVTKEKAEANVRLIFASKDMLSLIEKFVYQFGYEEPSSYMKDHICTAKRLIDKIHNTDNT